GYGITNVVNRATATAAELTAAELLAGGQRLLATAQRYHPRCIAVLGVTAYRAAFGRPKARFGRQDERIGEAIVWVLPNPSGLNAHYQPKDLARVFGELRTAIEAGAHP